MEKVSEKKFIETRARNLPIYKCLINEDWESAKLATVVVMRQHVTGNITFGFYLVDLLCLGVKDTGFKFNMPQFEVSEMFDSNTGFIKINYDLAHNIVFAALEFADRFEIPPHKDFKLTKFILQEDTDDVPLVDVATGDENGNPHLVVSSNGYENKYFINLEKYAADIYTWSNADEVDEEKEYGDDINDFKEDYENLSSFEIDTITPYDAIFINTDDLLDIEKVNKRGVLETMTLSIEIMRRLLCNIPKYKVLSEEEIIESPEFKLIQNASEDINGADGLISVNEFNKDDILLDEWQAIQNLENDLQMQAKSVFLEKNQKNIVALLLVYSSTLIVEEDMTEMKKNVCDKLIELTPVYPLATLLLAYQNTLTTTPDIKFSKILGSKDIQNAFPKIKIFGQDELGVYWLIKLNQSIKANKLADSIFYYRLSIQTTFEKNTIFLQTQLKYLDYLESIVK